MIGTLGRYFGRRFLKTMTIVLLAVFALVVLIDYVESMRRMSEVPRVSAFAIAKISLFRVPQIGERILPFCVLIAAMSSFLDLSRRLEFVVSRAAGLSAWQFTAPALIVALFAGVIATTAFNPIAAALAERSKRLEAEVNAGGRGEVPQSVNGVWLSQRSSNGYSVINAASSREQGVVLGNITVFVFDQATRFTERIEASTAELRTGHWLLGDTRVYATGLPMRYLESYELPTNLTPTQVRETFSTPETVPFWQLPHYIEAAEHAGLTASGYNLQFQKLLARPFMLAAMVMLAAAFSLRLSRFGGTQKMILGGLLMGFLLYVMSKVTDDLSKAELLPTVVGAWLPPVVGSLIGFVALLYQEDG
jgi:lipopolysaccharide export system permease protein